MPGLGSKSAPWGACIPRRQEVRGPRHRARCDAGRDQRAAASLQCNPAGQFAQHVGNFAFLDGRHYSPIHRPALHAVIENGFFYIGRTGSSTRLWPGHSLAPTLLCHLTISLRFPCKRLPARAEAGPLRCRRVSPPRPQQSLGGLPFVVPAMGWCAPGIRPRA